MWELGTDAQQLGYIACDATCLVFGEDTGDTRVRRTLARIDIGERLPRPGVRVEVTVRRPGGHNDLRAISLYRKLSISRTSSHRRNFSLSRIGS